jgi:hypothetical protein
MFDRMRTIIFSMVFSALFFGLFALSMAQSLTFMKFGNGYSFKVSGFSEFLDSLNGF